MPVESVIRVGSSALPLHSPGHDFCIFAANFVSKELPLLKLLSTTSHQYTFCREEIEIRH